ncbi:hypothetical protein GLV98_03440 [Halobacillus litoralis]|uniref:Uncharacterized protein n=1 Tax=Halobacillus litoralis TaxID=45668 RepID=A0A845E2U2_9BACI|nr:hypothetical protein [Halobacillus litoralis]MYL48516.1 hypothetical protein [Halobacillus litoralis]
MVIFILLTVAVYSSLMIFVLAKLGSVPAQTVMNVFRMKNQSSHFYHKNRYERTISAR